MLTAMKVSDTCGGSCGARCGLSPKGAGARGQRPWRTDGWGVPRRRGAPERKSSMRRVLKADDAVERQGKTGLL